MSEPVKVYARAADGTETDITEGVRTLYDLVIGSMDWGSGFLTVEDAEPVVHVAQTCGYADWEQAQEYVDARRHAEESAVFSRERGIRQWAFDPVPHDHVFSSVGKCMWPACKERYTATASS